MSQALYRKWRPMRFDQVVGQEHVTSTLQNSVVADRVGHAYLFCGPRGTGKTTSARLLAKAVNCLHDDRAQRPCDQCENCVSINNGRFLDLIEIDAASNTGVDDIRALRDKINFAPTQGKYKVYIIDEVHMLSTAAFNALLKTLEEPPPHAKFVLATTEEHKVPQTIKSRCQQFNFRLLSQSEIIGRLQWLAEKENLTVETQALRLVAEQGAGSLRDSESLLDQLVTIPGDTITLARTQQVLGTATSEAISQLVDAWLDGDGAQGLRIIQDALSTGTDARQFCRQMVGYLRQLLLLRAAGESLPLDGTAEEKRIMLAQARRSPRETLVNGVKAFNEAAQTPATSWQPQLPLELAFIQLLPDEPLTRTLPLPTASPQAQAVSATAPVVDTPAEPSPTKTEPQQTSSPFIPPELGAEQTAVVTPQPKPTLPDPEPTPAPSKTLILSLQQIRDNWRQMKQLVGQKDKNLPPLLDMSKPLATEGDTIILGVDFPIFKDKLEGNAEAMQLITKAYRQLLNQPINVRCVLTSEYNVQISPDEFHALADELGGVVRKE